MNSKSLQDLAKSNEYQILYTRCKEMGSLSIFKNRGDYSKLQIMFLYWLEIYNSLYMDLNLKKPHIDEDIINDILRVEAYLLLRYKLRDKEDNLKGDTSSVKKSSSKIPSVVFKRK